MVLIIEKENHTSMVNIQTKKCIIIESWDQVYISNYGLHLRL
jgi:lysophospholipid acyltransferase (LPLAT)-like uncharacterized protein